MICRELLPDKKHDPERIPDAMEVISLSKAVAPWDPFRSSASTGEGPLSDPSAGHLSDLQIVSHFRCMEMVVFQKEKPMKMFRRWLWYSSIISFTATAILVASLVCPASAAERILVGRISFVEGQLLRFVPAENDWVATVKDAPFGREDALYSDQNGKAELIMPNSTWIRIGGNTQLQLIALKTDVTEVDVASGLARFYNKSSNVLVKATTPFGYVVAQPGSTFDLYVGDQSVEVIALKNTVTFIHAGDDAKYEVVPGSPSIIADASRVGAGESNVDADWDDWNEGRDTLWAKRVSVKGASVKYLPPELQDQAYDFEENGRWESVYYQGQRRQLWRPTQVSAGWAPFTEGRWTDYYGDNTWVPAEPFGYATHHYGNWVYVNNGWYWGPPAAVGFGVNWYPGRVAWIGSQADAGWVPLAPREPYYSYYPWGPAAVVLGAAAVVGLTIGSLAYLNHAVVVPQRDFYGVNNYRSVRVANINRTTIINNYQGSRVVNNTILRGYDTNPNRYNFTDVNVANKPHQNVLTRIERNQGIAKREAGRVNANTLRQTVTRARTADFPTQTTVEPPRVTNKIVPTNKIHEPISEVQSQPKQIKQKPKQVQAPLAEAGSRPGSKQPPRPGLTGQSTFEPGARAPGRPERELQPTEPTTPGEGPKPPVRPGKKAQPGETKQIEEQGGPPKSPRDPVMKRGKTEPRAPGAGRQPQRQKEPVAPDGSTTKPQMQEDSGTGPAQSQPRDERVQQPKPKRQQVQQPRPERQQVQQIKPERQQGQQPNAERRQVQQPKAQRQQVQQIQPEGQQGQQPNAERRQVQQPKAQRQQVQQIKPEGQQVQQPNAERRQVQQPKAQRQQVQQPNAERRQVQQPKAQRQQVQQIKPEGQQVQQPRPERQQKQPKPEGQQEQPGGDKVEQELKGLLRHKQ
jgi:hypothetical protein